MSEWINEIQRMSYIDICRKAITDNNIFNNFKSLPAYNEILEHVSYEQGNEYLNAIANNQFLTESFLAIMQKNDCFGGPRVFPYSINGKQILLSPTTLRYIKVLDDLYNIFGDLSQFEIAEIGCGYGGQMMIIREAFNISNYTLFDLPDVQQLIQKCILHNGHNSGCHIGLLDNSFKKLDSSKKLLVISNYAFSEFDDNLQNEYYNQVVNYADNIYMTCNILPGRDASSLKKIMAKFPKSKILPEKPLTHPGNFIWVV